MSALPIPTELGDQPFTIEDVDEALIAAQTGEPGPEQVQRFTVDSDGAAEWCMRHVARLEVDAQAARDQYQVWRDQIDEWLATRLDHLTTRRAFFEAHLERYAIACRQADPKAKTLQLPSGTVATTERKPAVDLPATEGAAAKAAQDARVIAWLRETFPPDVLEAMEAIKVAESVLKTGLRKLLVVWLEVITVDGDGLEVEESRRWIPMLDDKGKPTRLGSAEIVVARYAVPPVNPTTGEAWADDVPVPDRAAPIAYVTAPSIEASVKPRPVLS